MFKEWCDALCECVYDRSLKSTLPTIISKLSDARMVNAELNNILYEPRREFIIMALLVAGNVPLMYFINKEWFATLMFSPLGKLTLAICRREYAKV